MNAIVAQCKHQMKDTKASTWKNEVFRQCKLQAKNDGYCDILHPDSIASGLARANFEQIISDLREIEIREERAVGAFMRHRDEEKFNSILADIRASEGVEFRLRRGR